MDVDKSAQTNKEQTVDKSPLVDIDTSLKEFITKEIPAAKNVILTKQVDGESYLVEITVDRDIFIGGQSDWNSLASETFGYTKTILSNNNFSRIHYTFISPANKNTPWASLWVKKQDLPENWKASYLFYFSNIKADPGTPQVSKWLCDFYAKYETSRPKGEMPAYCK